MTLIRLSLFILNLVFLEESHAVVSLKEAQRGQIQAIHEYYQGLKKLGPKATEAQKAELKNKTLFPAQMEYNNSLNSFISQANQDLRQSMFSSLKKHFPEVLLPKWILNPFSRGKNISENKSVDDSASKQKSSATLPPPPPPSPPQPETELDGSNLPKELNFPGKNKGKPTLGQPASSETPVINSGENQPVEVIDFKSKK